MVGYNQMCSDVRATHSGGWCGAVDEAISTSLLQWADIRLSRLRYTMDMDDLLGKRDQRLNLHSSNSAADWLVHGPPPWPTDAF